MSDEQPDFAPFPSPDHKTAFLSALRMLGVQDLEVQFSGGGDSGEVSGVSFTNNSGIEVDVSDCKLNWPREGEKYDPKTQQWTRTKGCEDTALKDIAISLTYDALETTNLDWYNNEGGQGSLRISFDSSPPEIELYVGTNYTLTEDHTFHFSDAS